jgi:hypothetical protein
MSKSELKRAQHRTILYHIAWIYVILGLMKNSREMLSAVGVVTILGVGATACGGNTQAEHKPSVFHIETSSPYGTKLENAAQRIIELAAKSPTRSEGKPPYSIGFTLTTREGSQISYSAQTATPKHLAPETELIEVQQFSTNITGSQNVANFDLSLYANNNGTWNMYCDTNPYSASGRKLDELGGKSIQLNGKTVDTTPADANAMLSDEVYNLNTLVGKAASMGNNAGASPNICNINIG